MQTFFSTVGVDPGINHCAVAVLLWEAEVKNGELLGFGISGLTTARIDTNNLGDVTPTLGNKLLAIHGTLSRYIGKDMTVVSEGISAGSNSSHYSMGAAHGMIQLAAAEKGAFLYRAAPLVLKKFFQGKGVSLGKEAVRDGVLKFIPYGLLQELNLTFMSHDEFDALGLAIMGGFVGPNKDDFSVQKVKFLLENSGNSTATFGLRAALEALNSVSLYTNFN